jgi:glycosyltransferase 2 family protein
LSWRYKNAAKFSVSAAVLACIGYFFYRAFSVNWATIVREGVTLHYPYLAAALACIVATYLVPTYGWKLTINALSSGGQLTFSQTVAAVNSSNLTKYIPGKIWSFAFQMYFLSAAGFAKSLVVYVNVINLLISLITSLQIGMLLLLPYGDKFPLILTAGSLLALLLADVLALKFHDGLFRRLVELYNRFSKRKIEYRAIDTKLVIELHLLHLFSGFAFGLAAYFACLGIGYEVPLRQVPLFMAALVLADTIAVAALIVPGGLGVREGIMYALLGGAASGPVALVLPIATRILHMIVDVGLGATALRLLRKLNQGHPVPTSEAASDDEEQANAK